jgi:two-component system phosphate regulon sensor histidine kinase PhoR
MAPTDIRDLITRTVAEMRPAIDAKGLALEVAIDPSVTTAVCDSSKIFHALVNFIDNATKYTEKGTVAVRAHVDNDWLVVEVTDTGIGMDPTDRARLFHLFERGISAVKLESSGQGLGLYIVKNIVEAHHGNVFIESAGKGKGSTFGFRIPLVTEKK